MLAVASAFDAKTNKTNLETLAARARHARRNLNTATVSALTKGLGALRATSGAPGVLSSGDDEEDGPSALIRPAESGAGPLAQFSAQVKQVNPLTAGIGHARSGTGRSLGVVQSQMVRLRQDFTRIDNQSRHLQATSRSARGTTGFSSRLLSSTLDLIV